MQNDSEEWKRKYDGLVQAKMERLKSLSPAALIDLRKQWAMLVADIQHALADDPASPAAQALASRWLTLLEQLMGTVVEPSMIGSATAYRDIGEWSPSAAAFADKRVWDFIRTALSARR
jgi:hypothetical protein